MRDPLTQRYLERRPWLFAQLRRAFPSATVADIEDALQDMWLDLRTSPRNLPAEPARVDGLMRCVAWRRLRGRYRRQAYKLEEARAWEQGHHPASQELVCERWRWTAHFGQVVAAWGGPDPEALARALTDKLCAHEPDTVLSQRHGLTRERLNGAWNALVEGILPRARRRSRR